MFRAETNSKATASPGPLKGTVGRWRLFFMIVEKWVCISTDTLQFICHLCIEATTGEFRFLRKRSGLENRIVLFFMLKGGGETIDAWSDYSIASVASSPPSSSIPGVSQDLKASTSFVRTSISSCRSRASVISMSMFLIQWQLHQVFPASKNPTYWWGLVAVEGDGLRVICCWYQ